MFWLHGEDLPAGVGNERFCAMHLVYIAFFFAASIAYVPIYRRLDARRQKAADRITGALVFFFGFCEYFITFLVGRFTLYTLPIHVCSLMYVLVPLHALTNHVLFPLKTSRLPRRSHFPSRHSCRLGRFAVP